MEAESPQPKYSEEKKKLLEAFFKAEQKVRTPELVAIIEEMALVGICGYDWKHVCELLCFQLKTVLEKRHEVSPLAEGIEAPLASFTELLRDFDTAPFTLQRICEMLTSTGERHYKLASPNSTSTFVFSFEKLVSVVSTIQAVTVEKYDEAISTLAANMAKASPPPPADVMQVDSDPVPEMTAEELLSLPNPAAIATSSASGDEKVVPPSSVTSEDGEGEADSMETEENGATESDGAAGSGQVKSEAAPATIPAEGQAILTEGKENEGGAAEPEAAPKAGDPMDES